MRARRRENGAGLIIVILIIAFLIAIGIPLLVLTGAGPKVAGSFRLHDEALNAAEAGFDAARQAIENHFGAGEWINFTGHYVTQPTNIDRPLDANGNPNAAYFRRRTDQELLSSFDTNGDGTPEVANLIFFQQTFALDGQGNVDTRYACTVFLIDDKAGTGTSDPTNALLVSIGVVRAGTRILDSVRLEVKIGL
jgi:hypothetical protein